MSQTMTEINLKPFETRKLQELNESVRVEYEAAISAEKAFNKARKAALDAWYLCLAHRDIEEGDFGKWKANDEFTVIQKSEENPEGPEPQKPESGETEPQE